MHENRQPIATSTTAGSRTSPRSRTSATRSPSARRADARTRSPTGSSPSRSWWTGPCSKSRTSAESVAQCPKPSDCTGDCSVMCLGGGGQNCIGNKCTTDKGLLPCHRNMLHAGASSAAPSAIDVGLRRRVWVGPCQAAVHRKPRRDCQRHP